MTTLLPLSASAEDTGAAVPQIRVTTENGSGTTLEKDDGYVSADISITDTDGSVLSDSVLFKVRGNSTALPFVTKKSFTFKFDKKKDVLGMGKAKKWALLANTFDPTLMRNYIAFEFARTMGLAFTSEQRYVELWLDDSFRGCYLLIEPVQAGKERVDIDVESNGGKNDFMIELEKSREEADVAYFTTDGIRFAVKEPEEPTDDQLAYIQSTMDGIVNTLKTGDRMAIEEKIDVPSFARFYLLNELYKTLDFNFSSVFFYYKNGVLYAGPVWDYDLAAGNAAPDLPTKEKNAADPEGIFAADYHLYRYLTACGWFREEIRAVYLRYFFDIKNIYDEDGFIDGLLADYGAVFDRNYSDAGWNASRWWVNVQKKPLSTYMENVDFLSGWLRQRNEWLRGEYGLYLIGDTDDDLIITVIDATAIQRILVELDRDEDGKASCRGKTTGEELNILDATAIQRKLVNFAVSAPIGEPSLY